MRPATYRLYGLNLRCSVPLPCPRSRAGGPADVSLGVKRAPARSRRGGVGDPAAWFRYRKLDDESSLLQWKHLFEFVVSADGRRIESRQLSGASRSVLQDYLLSQVLSFSLLAFGREPLHASGVAVPGGMIAFVGGCGTGKSSLTAAFLAAGHRLVTDDVLVLDRRGEGYVAQPGLPRIKLYPRVARRVLGVAADGERMHPATRKQILTLAPRRAVGRRLPVLAVYVLPHRGRAPGAARRPRITRLSPRRALLELVGATFNSIVIDRARLVRQFRFARDVALRVPVKRLVFPRRLEALPAVRQAILRDLAGGA